LDPSFSFAHIWLAQAFQQKGQFDEAIAELQTGVRLSGESGYALSRLAYGHAVAGNRDDARAVLTQVTTLATRKYVSAYDIAMVYAGLQDVDEAFARFEEALEQRSVWLGYLRVEPQLDPLRNDVRFHDLLRRVGLPCS
jgi:tetratricopeptide (TPR) repeat protein